MKAKELIIAGGGTAIVGGLIYFFLHKAKQQSSFNELLLVLEENKAETAGNLGYLNAFQAGFEKTSSNGKRVILLTTAAVESDVDTLYTAMKGWGTDEDAIYNTYSGIQSQRKMAQLATRYAAKYGENLLDRINSELNNNERTKLFNIVKSKPIDQFA
jgi:putative cell wall-binding protein